MKKGGMIKTSVIIPVYNTSLYLEECIDSVYNQTQKEIEVIIIDDGSTDDSLDVLYEMKKKYSNMKIISQENHCQGYARNVGLKIAKGEYIYFLDSDDFILEHTLEECYKCASENKLEVVLFDALDFEDSAERTPIEPNFDDRHRIVSEREEIFSGIFYLEKYYQKTYNPSTCLVYCSTNFLKENDIWFLPDVYFEDNEFYCKIMMLAERVMYIPKMFYQCRCRETSTTRTKFDLRKARDHIEVINAIAELKERNNGKGWGILRKISLHLLWYVATMCCSNKLYYKDERISERILETWIKVCGCNIEDVENIEDINFIYDIAKKFPAKKLSEKKELINAKRRWILKQIFEQLPLNQRGCKVAIYGCGEYTNRLLEYYEAEIGVIVADVIFIDTYIKDSGMKYRGYPIYPINDIKGKDLDYILISSPQYEEEIHEIILQLYGGKYMIVSLYGDLHISL